MIADMTGPNGSFIPRNQAQQAGSYQPLQSSEAGEAMEMQQRQSRTQPGHDYRPVQQGEMEEREVQPISRGDVNHSQMSHEQMDAGSPMAESAMRRGKQRAGNGPGDETHPALRND